MVRTLSSYHGTRTMLMFVYKLVSVSPTNFSISLGFLIFHLWEDDVHMHMLYHTLDLTSGQAHFQLQSMHQEGERYELRLVDATAGIKKAIDSACMSMHA